MLKPVREPMRLIVGLLCLGAGALFIVWGIQKASLPLGLLLLSLIWFAGAFWLLEVRLSWRPVARINWASVSPGLLVALLGLCMWFIMVATSASVESARGGVAAGAVLLFTGLTIILGRAIILNGVSVRGRLGDFARTLFGVLVVTSFAVVTIGVVLGTAQWPTPAELEAGASRFPRLLEGAICVAPSAVLLSIWALAGWIVLIRQLLRALRLRAK